MAYKITLPLSEDWTVERDVTIEEGSEVTTFYAYVADKAKKSIAQASIELYVGEIPEDSSAYEECLNNYDQVIGLNEDEESNPPIYDIDFMGGEGCFYEAEDDAGAPVVLICVEPVKGTLVMAILSQKDDESLEELIHYVSDNLKVE